MKFYAYHGLFEQESTLGQRFEVDLELGINLEKAGISDNMQDSVHYGEVYDLVEDIVVNKRYNLLEALAHGLVQVLLEKDQRIEQVHVAIRKPSVPIKGIMDYAEVEIRRKRNA